MSAQLGRRPTLYETLEALPDALTGEIIDGQLHAQPRPRWAHSLAASRLGTDIEAPYSRGRGGPGGWWILVEPEVHFILDTEVVVPDWAGWRKERRPTPPDGHKIEATPSWVCEVLSPSTRSVDREIKMPLYARHGVEYAWLVDPSARTLETYVLEDGRWTPGPAFANDDLVIAAPFDAITIRLADLWGQSG